MSEKPENEASNEPAPVKESDANRVTEEEAEHGPTRSDEDSDNPSE